MKPIIGITTFRDPRQRKSFSCVSHNYVTSVAMAGGIPVLIPIVNDEEMLDGYLDLIDGLLFSGGEDVSPLEYQENPLQQVRMVCCDRDRQEISLLKKAYDRKMPVLGICRGHQMMNVALGGNLYQDIWSQVKGALGHDPADNPVSELYHKVHIDENSRLYEIIRISDLAVNSFHHQAIKELGHNLRAVAFSSEGIIEAVEAKDGRFLLGIQWHPEDLTVRYPHFLSIFKSLVDAAAREKK